MARCDKLEGGLVQVSVKDRNNYVLVRTQAKKVFPGKINILPVYIFMWC
jgi:hypothetical protein